MGTGPVLTGATMTEATWDGTGLRSTHQAGVISGLLYQLERNAKQSNLSGDIEEIADCFEQLVATLSQERDGDVLTYDPPTRSIAFGLWVITLDRRTNQAVSLSYDGHNLSDTVRTFAVLFERNQPARVTIDAWGADF